MNIRSIVVVQAREFVLISIESGSNNNFGHISQGCQYANLYKLSSYY